MSGSDEARLPNLVVLISGGGSNLQAIIDAAAAGALPMRLRAVISNRDDAFGLERARRGGIDTAVLDHRRFDSREAFDAELRKLIDSYSPDAVALAGFMRILTPELVQHYTGRMFNIHPSLLPKFRGLHTHQRAIDAKEQEHGASVHFVTAELDGGPVVLQARVPVLRDDDADRLGARVLAEEHKIYPLVLRWFAEGRLTLGDDGRPMLDEQILERPRLRSPQEEAR